MPIQLNQQSLPTLTEPEVFLLFNILDQIAGNAERHKSEFVVSSCEFLFEIDYGIFETFQSVRSKVQSQALNLMMKNYPGNR